MYKLPNGKKMDERGIAVAATNNNVFNHYFLDTKTGKVKLVSEEFESNFEKLLKRINMDLNKRYFEIPKVPEKQRRAWMKDFVDFEDDQTLKNKLNFVLSKTDGFQIFERVLYNHKTPSVWGWVQWKIDSLWHEFIIPWIDKIDIGAVDEWEYDNDCPVCQFMKKMDEKSEEPSLEGLKNAFLKAKRKGGIVGGEWFEGKRPGK